MSQWPSTKATRVLSALHRIGWQIKRQSGSHRTNSGRRGKSTGIPRAAEIRPQRPFRRVSLGTASGTVAALTKEPPCQFAVPANQNRSQHRLPHLQLPCRRSSCIGPSEWPWPVHRLLRVTAKSSTVWAPRRSPPSPSPGTQWQCRPFGQISNWRFHTCSRSGSLGSVPCRLPNPLQGN